MQDVQGSEAELDPLRCVREIELQMGDGDLLRLDGSQELTDQCHGSTARKRRVLCGDHEGAIQPGHGLLTPGIAPVIHFETRGCRARGCALQAVYPLIDATLLQRVLQQEALTREALFYHFKGETGCMRVDQVSFIEDDGGGFFNLLGQGVQQTSLKGSSWSCIHLAKRWISANTV